MAPSLKRVSMGLAVSINLQILTHSCKKILTGKKFLSRSESVEILCQDFYVPCLLCVLDVLVPRYFLSRQPKCRKFLPNVSYMSWQFWLLLYIYNSYLKNTFSSENDPKALNMFYNNGD